MLVRKVLTAAACLLCACAGGPPAQLPGKARVFGAVQLVPHEGVEVPSGSGGSYGSRRMRDVELVDYSKPGFAVVYAGEATRPGGSAEIAIRDTRIEPRFEPAELAIGAGGHLTIVNDTGDSHMLSYPAAGLFERIKSGTKLEIDVPDSGEQHMFLVDVLSAEAVLFVAPGAYDVVSTSGEYELRNLEPGAVDVHAWHPRFPPAVRRVELTPDASMRVDLQMGVDVAPGDPAHAP
jgi:hypothetical protein